MPFFLRHKVNKVRLTLLIAVAFTMLAAGIFRTPPIIFMAALLLGAPLLGVAIGRFGSRRLEVARTLPASGEAGEIVEGVLRLRNRSRWPALLAHVHCGEGHAPHARRNRRATDRWDEDALTETGGYPVAAIGSPLKIIPLLGGGEEIEWRQGWLLQRRGVFEIAPVRAGMQDPLGLYDVLDAKTLSQEIVVLPRPVRIDRLGLLNGSEAGDAWPQHATVVADALDFHSVRPWLPGEAIRRVHWKSTARTRQLHVVEWEETVASDLTILLDAQSMTIAGDEHDNTLEASITAAASIAAYLLENGYHLQLFCWQASTALRSGQSSEAPSGRLRLARHEVESAGGLAPTLELLARLQPVENSQATLSYLAERAQPLLPPGRQVLLLTSSLADIEAALDILAGTSGIVATRALVMDAAGFDATAPPASLPIRLQPLLRVVRRGDALAEALEYF